MHIPLGTVQNIHVGPFAQLFFIQRAVTIGNHIALCIRDSRCSGFQKTVKFRCFFGDAPHLQKHQRKALYRFPFQHDGSILPVTVLFNMVDVLVRQIYAAGKGDVSIDHQNLTMIPVSVVGRYKWCHWGEHFALDTQLAQTVRVIVRQGAQLTGTIIHHPDIHALNRLFRKDLQYFSPHQPLVNDEVFQKDKLLRLLQLLQHFLPFGLAGGEIGDCRLIIYRVASASVNILRQICHAGVFLFQCLECGLLLWELVSGLVN